MSEFAALLDGMDAAATGNAYRACAVESCGGYYAALSPSGRPALLVRCSTTEHLMPIRLAGIEARYNAQCLYRDDQHEAEERLSIIECLIDGDDERQLFCSCADQLVSLLGPSPSTKAVGQAVDRLVSMFRALNQPARQDVVGLLGELCVVYGSSNAAETIRSWHLDPMERFDFVAGNLRLDVKSASGESRVHHISALQASPPAGMVGVIASVLVSLATGGTSLREFIALIESRLAGDQEGSFRLSEAVTVTMGASLQQALQVRFDLDATMQSMRFFETAAVPALRPPFPDGVYDVRFRSDLDLIEPAQVVELINQLDLEARAVLPEDAMGH